MISGKVSVKRSYDMYIPYTYVTPLQEVEVTISGMITVTEMLLSIHDFI